MYRLGERKPNHRKFIVWLVGCVLILAATVFAISALARPDTTISPPPPPKVSKITYDQTQTKHFDEPLFGIDLPPDWKLTSLENTPSTIYQWSGTTKDDETRSLKLYVDNTPATLGVNRAVAVQANGNKLLVESDVSDNCANFTQPSSSEPVVATHAKWNGSNFLCDLGNYIRDVVGTSSPQGINVVTLTGSITGKHNLFFTYTDNSPSPDYVTFINALKSFQLK